MDVLHKQAFTKKSSSKKLHSPHCPLRFVALNCVNYGHSRTTLLQKLYSLFQTFMNSLLFYLFFFILHFFLLTLLHDLLSWHQALLLEGSVKWNFATILTAISPWSYWSISLAPFGDQQFLLLLGNLTRYTTW